MRCQLKVLLLKLLRIYSHYLSPMLPAHCRFHPSCSCYMHEAIDVHGFWHGAYLGTRRILKCHPWHEGGLDPVPPRQDSNHINHSRN